MGALFSKGTIRPLLVGSSLMLFQQITGQPSVLYYAAKIFKDAGFASDADATRVSVVLGFFKLIMTGETTHGETMAVWQVSADWDGGLKGAGRAPRRRGGEGCNGRGWRAKHKPLLSGTNCHVRECYAVDLPC